LPPPRTRGCEWLIGVPAYDDDKDYHRPGIETIEHSLNGIVAALRAIKDPGHFRGVAIYASFTTDAQMGRLRPALARRGTRAVPAARSAGHDGIAG
jgi:hypothetical protein